MGARRILFIFFPKYNPIYVNKAADIENIIEHTNGFLYIALSPIPTEKLSRLTANPKINNSLKFISERPFSCLNDSIIISIPINISIINTTMLLAIGKYFIYRLPIKKPIVGIKK